MRIKTLKREFGLMKLQEQLNIEQYLFQNAPALISQKEAPQIKENQVFERISILALQNQERVIYILMSV